MPEFQPQDIIVYEKTKESKRPGPRARDVYPTPNGDTYLYVVDKFWLVQEILEDRTMRVVTRTGKEHLLSCDDPCVRPVRWWEKLFFKSRFPNESRLTGVFQSPVAAKENG